MLILGFSLGLNYYFLDCENFIKRFFYSVRSFLKFRTIKVGAIYGCYYDGTYIDHLTTEYYYKLVIVKEKTARNLKIEIIDQPTSNSLYTITLPRGMSTSGNFTDDILSYKDVAHMRLYQGNNPKVKKYEFAEQLKPIIDETQS